MKLITKIKNLLFPTQQDILETDTNALRLTNAVEFGRFSFELEEKREQSLITQSGHMLTAISLYSAALIMLLPLVVELQCVSSPYLWGASATIFLPLLVGFVCTLLAQWRYKYDTLIDGKAFLQHFESDASSGYYKDQSDFDYQWTEQLSAVQSSKTRVNHIRCRLIKVGMISFLVSVVFLLIAWLIIVIKAL